MVPEKALGVYYDCAVTDFFGAENWSTKYYTNIKIPSGSNLLPESGNGVRDQKVDRFC